MEAVDFIRKFGWVVAQKAVMKDNAPYATHAFMYDGELGFSVSGSYGFCTIKELKKFTEAYELVQSYGGLVVAKNCEYTEDLDHVKYNVELAKAIALVEEVGILGECDE